MVFALISNRKVRKIKEKYIIPTFIFDSVEAIITLFTVNYLMLPPYNDRDLFYIVVIVYLLLRIYKILIGKSYSENFGLILIAIGILLVLLVANLILKSILFEYICGIFLLTAIIVFSVNLIRKLKREYSMRESKSTDENDFYY
jgi:FtsH-binding integral membrane protein